MSISMPKISDDRILSVFFIYLSLLSEI